MPFLTKFNDVKQLDIIMWKSTNTNILQWKKIQMMKNLSTIKWKQRLFQPHFKKLISFLAYVLLCLYTYEVIIDEISFHKLFSPKSNSSLTKSIVSNCGIIFLTDSTALYLFCPQKRAWKNKTNTYLERSHHHHQDVPSARISLTISRHFSLSFITSGRSSGLHPLSSHSCCM